MMISFWLIFTFLILGTLALYIPQLIRGQSVGRAQILSLVVFLFSFTLMYLNFGDSASVGQFYDVQAKQVELSKMIAKGELSDDLLQVFKSKLQANPDDVNGWYLLAKLHLSINKYDQAIEYMTKAHDISPQFIPITTQLIQMRFMANQMRLDPPARQLVTEVLQREPNNLDGLNFLALDAFNQKQYGRARQYWQNILATHDLDHDEAEMIKVALKKVDNFSRGEPEIKALQIHVTLSVAQRLPKLHKRLFVSAHRVHGTKVPLAVAQLDVPKFPKTVSLDEMMNMLPGHQLELGQSVYIRARLSASGSADPDPKDWVVQSDPFIVAAEQNIKLTLQAPEKP